MPVPEMPDADSGGFGGRSTRRSRWDRYTTAAVGGNVEAQRRRQEFPAVRGAGGLRPAVTAVLQRIRTIMPKRRSAPARIYPLLELRLVPVAAASWVAAALAVRAGSREACIAAAVLAGTAVLSLVLALIPSAPGTRHFPLAGRLARTVAAPLAAAGMVCIGAGMLLAERTAGPIGPAISSGASITGEFRASTDARAVASDRFDGGSRYAVEGALTEATADGERFGAAATVLVIGGTGFADVHLGDRFSAAGSLQATEPGERAVALLYANGTPDIEPAGGWYGQTAQIRTAFAQAAAGQADLLGEAPAGLLPGMVLGDRSTLDKDLEAAMQNTGLTHLTAVSGANCGYLLAFVFLTARSVRLPRAVASAAGVLALVGFVLVVRPDASVLRAAVMGGLGTLAVLSGRGKLPAALLCLSITVLLAVDPWLSGSYAFILSVLATSGLVLLGPRLTELLSRRMPWPLAAALAVPLAAQLFCSPVLVLLQPQVPVYSLPANIAAAPVIPLVTVAGMAAAVLTAALPPLAAPLLLAAGAGAAWTSFVARFFSSLPGALLPWPGGAPGAVLMAGAGAVVIWVVLRAGKAGNVLNRANAATAGSSGNAGRPRSRGGPPAGLTAAVPLAVALLLLPPAAAAAWMNLVPGPAPPGWSAVVCDVGQGDGLVVRTAEHSALVIDAGPDPDAMDGCLHRLEVDTVDLLILTHAHLDHYGGTEGVLRQRAVHRIAYSTAEAQLPPQLDALLKGSGAEMTRLTEGMSAQAGPVKWDVLWPPRNSPQATENDASAVVLVTVDPEPDAQPAEPQLTMLLTGDIEQDAALTLLSRHAWLRTDGVDVLKVPHHGARNGGTALITELRPRVALISVGADNDYGHPGPAILSTLKDTGTTVARTDLLGSISLDLDGKTLRVGGLDGR